MAAMSKKTTGRKREGKETLYVELPEELRLKERMEALADAHRRSMSGEVIVALEEYLARHETKEEGEGGKS
jgi:predicted transcriptional regulator